MLQLVNKLNLRELFMRHYSELDSLRGIAAFIVMLAHCTIVGFYNQSSLWFVLNDTPLRFFWSGHQSVIFFFILSGFVLSLPFIEKKDITYSGFMIKRICRIYIPYVFAICSAVIIRVYFSWNSVVGFETYKFWSTPITSDIILKHLYFIGVYNYTAFDTAMWSLVHEMRISIIFPIVLAILLRRGFKTSLGTALCLSAFASIIEYWLVPHVKHLGNFHETLHYLSLFIIGSLLAESVK